MQAVQKAPFRRIFSTQNLTVTLAVIAVAMAIATYILITRHSSLIELNPTQITLLALVNLTVVLMLAALVARRAFGLYIALRRGTIGSRLQKRVLLMFSLVAMVPTLLVALFSVLFFNFGVKSWFDTRVSSALEGAVRVAEGYLAEHKEVIRADILAMANDLNREAYRVGGNPQQFKQIVSGQAALRSLTEAIVFQRDSILARTDLSFSLTFEKLDPQTLRKADEGQVVILTTEEDDRVRALIKLDAFVQPTYLLVGRFVDAKVVEHTQTTQGAVAEYRRMQSEISDLQIKFILAYVLISLLLLLAAISYGMSFAGRLAKPLSRLVEASERIRGGDYQVKVREGPEGDEFGALARAFNRMTSQLESQRNDLINTNRQLDERRRLSEMVLAGVSAGVLALDDRHRITHANRSALQWLEADRSDIAGKTLEAVIPELKSLMGQATRTPDKAVQDDLEVLRDDKRMTLHVRIAAEKIDDGSLTYIVTFDDITEFVRAQRNAAWADVARRIAHEIKNPLTPIQLSAERLQRKFAAQIEEGDQEQFARYTDTISRHVRDIGKIVEEFVTFARMPAPVFASENLTELITKAVFSEKQRQPDIAYDVQLPEQPLHFPCDARQIRQVLTNLLKNAAESVTKGKEDNEKGRIAIELSSSEETITLRISDNGPGFPPELLDRATEPYVSSKGKGNSGLGLAIVSKIVDDHHGKLTLANLPEGGAEITMTFPSASAFFRT